MTSFLRKAMLLVAGFWLVTFAVLGQQAPALGTFYDFNVVGYQKVVSTNNTIVRAKLASVLTDAEGFPPGVVRQGIENRTPAAIQAHKDAASAYSAALNAPNKSPIDNARWGSGPFTPGVYEFNGDATINANVKLNAQGNSNAVFIFIIRGNLSITSGSNVELDVITKTANVFWIVEKDLVAGNGSLLSGNYLVKQNITLGDGAGVRGRVAALEGEVGLNQNSFTLPTDLEITISKSPGSMGEDYYVMGETITYTINAINNGPIDDGEVLVKLSFTGIDYTFNPDGQVEFVNNEWQWKVGSLLKGATKTLTITAKIPATNNGLISGSIAGVTVDEIQQNNSKTLSFCAVLPKPGDITGPAELCVLGEGEYSIPQVEGITNYYWEVPSGWKIVSGQGTTKIKVEASVRNDNAQIQVTVSNSCGASPPSRLKVGNYPDKPEKPGPITPHEGLCAGDGASYSIQPVLNATSYIWSVPEDWKIISGDGTTKISVQVGTVAGKVTVIAANACGQSIPTELEVKPFLGPPATPTSISGDGKITICVTTERVSFSVRASTDVKEYVWKNYPTEWEIISGQGTNTITFDPNGKAGTISVNGINSCGGSSPITFEVVVVPDLPVLPGEINGSFPICKGSEGTKYWIAEVPYAFNYVWAVPTGWTITSGQGTNEITVKLSTEASSGELSVVVTNTCGKIGESSKPVIATTAKPIAPAKIEGEQFTCFTTEAYYQINQVEGAQDYVWEVPQGWVIVEGQGTTRIKVKFGTTEGAVTVKARNSCGLSDPASLQVKPFSPIPSIPFVIIGPGKDICVGQKQVVFQLDPVDQAQRYTWALPDGWTIKEGQGTNRIVVEVTTGAKTGKITVRASNPCGTSQAAELAVTPLPDVPAPKPGPITGQAQYCAGLNQTYSIAAVPGATSYHWTFPGADWVILNGEGTTSITVKAGATQGQVRVASVNNCGSIGATSGLTVVNVGEVPPAPIAITSDSEPYCSNASNLIYRIQAVPTAVHYEWKVPAGWTITAGQGTTQITANAGTSGGEITVVAINSCGQSEAIALATAPQRPLVNPEAIQGPAIPCFGRTDALYSVPAIDGAVSYEWSIPQGWKILEGANTNRIRVQVGTNGEIKLKARNACGATAEVSKKVTVVTAGPFPPAAILGETTTCATRTATYSIAEVATAATYNWAVPAGWTILSGQGSPQITVQVGTTSGDVKVNSENDCGKSADIALAVTATPLPTISRILDRTIACEDIATFELESNSTASTYTWEVPAGWEILSGQGTSIITVMQGDAKGEVKVVADDGQCVSDPVVLYSDPSLREATLVIPNVFSPNNDGNNDTWEIGNLQNFAGNDLVILNRWGNEVYKSKSYQNNWNGDKLAEGTYYYVLRVTLCNGNDKVFKGYVMIVR
ncbi:hypothetical protein OB13_05635 [Pontibacter sp. HJ8]